MDNQQIGLLMCCVVVLIPLVIGVGIGIGIMFAVILAIALRAQRVPAIMGMKAVLQRTGIATDWSGTAGQVQVGSELWSAEASEASPKIRKGDRVEVVQAKGLRLIVKKK